MTNVSDSDRAVQQRRAVAVRAAVELVSRKGADTGAKLTELGEVTVEVAKVFERYMETGA